MQLELRSGSRVFAAILLVLAHGLAAAATFIEVEPMRRFGYTVGDMVQQTLHLKTGAGQTLIEDSLPKTGRAGLWFARRQVEATPEAGGWRITLNYQFINAPTEVRVVPLPPIRLRLRDGERTLEEVADEVPLTLAPLTAAMLIASTGSQEIRPDTPPPLVDVSLHRYRLMIYATGAGLIGLLWGGWYFGVGLRGRRVRVFAQAARELRRLPAHDSSPLARRDAMRILHRAFNASAGMSVFIDSLDAFFSSHPEFAPARDEVAKFFIASREEFFGSAEDGGKADGGVTSDVDVAKLKALAIRLKSLERNAT